MKYSYNWLKKISGTKLSPEKLAELLMMHSFEVEGIEKVENKLDEKVIVGKILEIKKHPNADKLQIVNLQTTNQKLKTVQVVCGAWNIKVGDKVPTALVGAKLPNGMEIKAAEIRGEKSFGMLCAEDELGLGTDHSGIIILDKESKIGEPVGKILKLNDSILDIDVLANRGHDALNYVGMAREICALENRKLKYNFQNIKNIKRKENVLKVEIKDTKLCPRYIGAVIKNVEIKESPIWAKIVLKANGIRPINSVVDATNYVMLELGQPLHAFDFEKISGMQITNHKSQITNKSQNSNFKNQNVKIIVRRAKEGEEIKLLDGSVKILTADDLVIADEKKALAIAGVMGGEDSGITNETKDIIIESANFNAVSIRKTRTRLGILTDASSRYEKDIDPNLTEIAMARVVEILKYFNGEVADIKDIYSKKINPWKINLDLDYVNKLLGENIPAKTVVKILNSLELQTTNQKLKTIAITVPTFRIDLKTQEDLIEEIGRIYGYEKIKSQAPKVELQAAKINEERLFERQVKNILAGKGFSEVYNYSFYSVHDAGLAQLGTIKHLELQNPANPDQALMRVSLIPGILRNVHENLKQFKDFKIFETGRVYWPDGTVLPREKRMLVGAIVLEKDKGGENFFEAKGYVDNLLAVLGIENQYYDDFDASPIETFDTLWHAGRRAAIKIEGQTKAIGFLGEINPLVAIDFDIHKRVAIFEFDLEFLQKAAQTEKKYKPINKFPTVIRDISMMTKGKIKVADIIKNIKKVGGALILNVHLFDIFEKENQTSLAFHVEFGDERTLESEEVDNLMKKITSVLETNLKVSVRK